jgi:hypothetical protein
VALIGSRSYESWFFEPHIGNGRFSSYSKIISLIAASQLTLNITYMPSHVNENTLDDCINIQYNFYFHHSPLEVLE